MKTATSALAAAAALLLSGCIVRDEVTTICIHPDGSARVVVFHANIRSTQEGGRAEQDLRRYAEDFDSGRAPDLVRFAAAGGEVLERHWLQREAPYSTAITARLPNAAAIEAFGSVKGEDGELQIETRFSIDGPLAKLKTAAVAPREFRLRDASSARLPGELQQDRANGFSETRIVVVSGRILAAQGWTVAADKRSALLCTHTIAEMLRATPERIELFLEWELDGP